MNPAHSWPTQSPTVARSTRPNRRRLETISTIATSGLVVMFAVFVLGMAAAALYGSRYDNRVYEGAAVAGVDLGGMTREEVRTALDERFAAFSASTITFTAGDQEFKVPVSDLGITLNEEATIDRVMAYGRDGNLWNRSIAWVNGYSRGVTVEPVLDVNDAMFREAIATFAPDLVYAPMDAQIDMSVTGKAELIDDQPGVVLDIGATRTAVVRDLGALEPVSVPVALVSVPASVQTADIEAGLPQAQRAVSSAIVLTSDDGKWGLTRSQLNALVSVGASGELQVDEAGARTFVEGVATEIDHPSADAAIEVDANGNFVVAPQVDAASVDVDATTSNLVSAIRDGKTNVTIEVARETPAITTEMAQEWSARAEEMIADGLTLTWHGGESQLGRADLLAALVIEPKPGEEEPFSLTFDAGVVAERLGPLASDLHVEAKDAQFRLVDDEIRFQQEARNGRELNVDKSVEQVMTALDDGESSVGIVVDTIKPRYSSSARSDIKLPDLLGESRTWYGESSEPRRHNVERAVDLEDGWLIAPDAEFSYAELMGLVDEENGFVTGFGIVADPGGGVTTAPVVGGGICQVSTTIFQAAFWAGMPITERWQHPYWIRSYGEAPFGMQGLDAMVNIEPDWALDLRFKNTTGNWIALVMSADGENVYAELRGTNPGWKIDINDPVISDVVKPDDKMRYTDSPELPKGQELQVEHAREGFTSTITRVVRDDNGRVVDSYELVSTYSASRNLTLRGTGTGD